MTQTEHALAMLQMRVAELWMQATGEQFVDIAMDSHVQCDRISRELSQSKLSQGQTTYTCVAGKYDMGERNCKYSGPSHTTLDEAMKEWHDLRLGTYPWGEIEIVDEYFRTTIDPADVSLRVRL